MEMITCTTAQVLNAQNPPINTLANFNFAHQAKIDIFSSPALSNLLDLPCMHICMAPLQALSLLLLASLAGSAAPPSGYRFELTHVDSKGGFTKRELMRRAEHRSRLRATTLSSARQGSAGSTSSTSDARSRLHWSQSEYLMELAIGTPPVPFVAIADTGSDLIWTQSQPCTRCFPQSTPIYNPFASPSFSLVPCSSAVCQGSEHFPLNSSCTPPLCRYHYEYGDMAFSEGVMGTETLTFRSGTPGKFVSVGGVAFGCGNVNEGASFNSTGTVGLGRGPLSLVAQLGFGKFSYCLTTFFEPKLTSPLLFGSLADLTTGGRSGAPALQTTPLVQSPQNPTWYYVSLEGLSFGDTRLPIPKDAFELHSNGTGGMLVDSGSTYTRLQERAFRVVVKHVEEIMIGQPDESNCYQVPDGKEPPTMPDMVLHFAGGADMRLHRDNYMIFDRESSALCLAITGAPGMSILGNFQQQNMHMLYDITVGRLSFVPADCSKL